MAGVVVGQALQRLAGLRGSALRYVRLQSGSVFSELHGSSRGGLCATGAIDTAWCPRPAPLARPADRPGGSSEGCAPGRPGRVGCSDEVMSRRYPSFLDATLQEAQNQSRGQTLFPIGEWSPIF